LKNKLANNEIHSKEDLEAMFPDGIPEEISDFISSMEMDFNKNYYNRILSLNEKIAIEPEAFGYLMKIFNIGSINKDEFERILSMSSAIYSMTNLSINENRMVNIIDLVLLSPVENFTMKHILDAINKPNDKYELIN